MFQKLIMLLIVHVKNMSFSMEHLYHVIYNVMSMHNTQLYVQKAVALLQKRAKGDGWFLVRPNSRRPGYYALTLVYNNMPYHYEIVCEV